MVIVYTACWFVQGELDELEREEFFRLKKVQKNKQKVAAKEQQAKEAAVRPVMMGCITACCISSPCHAILF